MARIEQRLASLGLTLPPPHRQTGDVLKFEPDKAFVPSLIVAGRTHHDPRPAPFRRHPPVAVRGEGIYLHTADGRRIIDASGGAAVACLGHGNRRVAEAIGRQAAAMAYAHTGTSSTSPPRTLRNNSS